MLLMSVWQRRRPQEMANLRPPPVMSIRGFGKMIRIQHRSVTSGILLAATSYVHQSFHTEPDHEVRFRAVSSVLLSH